MKDKLIIVAMILGATLMAFLMLGLIVLGNSVASSGQRVYNCMWAEISPDFTPKMREECRKLQRESK